VAETYPRGSIVMLDLEPVIGSEQGRRRPCVVVSDARVVRASRARLMYAVVPLTRSQALIGPLAPRLKQREGGLPADSTALCMHVRSVDPARVSGRVRGALAAEEMVAVQRGLAVLFGLEAPAA
jgi:mRNA interferase MazF